MLNLPRINPSESVLSSVSKFNAGFSEIERQSQEKLTFLDLFSDYATGFEVLSDPGSLVGTIPAGGHAYIYGERVDPEPFTHQYGLYKKAYVALSRRGEWSVVEIPFDSLEIPLAPPDSKFVLYVSTDYEEIVDYNVTGNFLLPGAPQLKRFTTVPTPENGANDNRIASTAFVKETFDEPWVLGAVTPNKARVTTLEALEEVSAGDKITLDSETGTVTADSYKVGSVEVIDSAQNAKFATVNGTSYRVGSDTVIDGDCNASFEDVVAGNIQADSIHVDNELDVDGPVIVRSSMEVVGDVTIGSSYSVDHSTGNVSTSGDITGGKLSGTSVEVNGSEVIDFTGKLSWSNLKDIPDLNTALDEHKSSNDHDSRYPLRRSTSGANSQNSKVVAAERSDEVLVYDLTNPATPTPISNLLGRFYVAKLGLGTHEITFPLGRTPKAVWIQPEITQDESGGFSRCFIAGRSIHLTLYREAWVFCIE